MNKYIESFKNGLLQQLTERGQLIGRLFVYGVVVFLYFQIFESVQAPTQQFLYFSMTEVIILSTELVAFKIADDFASGQFTYFLLRPLSYPLFRLMETLGIAIIRYFVLFLAYGVLRYFLHAPFTVEMLIGFCLGFFGLFLYSLLSLLIGLLSFWIQDIKSIVYLNLTFVFCFGGLIVPFEKFPILVQKISLCTPYPWILWWPAKWVAGFPQGNEFSALLLWFFWTIVLLFCISFVMKRCIRSFIQEGCR